jgi:hypothetical protein
MKKLMLTVVGAALLASSLAFAQAGGGTTGTTTTPGKELNPQPLPPRKTPNSGKKATKTKSHKGGKKVTKTTPAAAPSPTPAK